MKIGCQNSVQCNQVAGSFNPRKSASDSANSQSRIAPQTAVQVIASHYDVTNISQGEIVRMGKDLVSKGLMSETDMAVMTISLPEFQLNPDGSVANVFPKKDDGARRDLVAEYKSRIEFDELHGADSSVLHRILGVLQNVQAVRGGVATYA